MRLLTLFSSLDSLFSWSFDSSRGRRVVLLASLTTLAGLSMACLASVDGERAATGECPPGERCSDATPEGLAFIGRAFFDEPRLRLGPVLVGGTFELGLRTADGAPLPPFSVESDNVFRTSIGQGTFGPTSSDGEPLYPVDAHLALAALRPGTSHIRIVDAASGALFDRLELEAVELEDVRVVVAQEPERLHLLAGCDEMVGVRLLADDDAAPLRAFDQGMTVQANGAPLHPEPLFWDCVVYSVPPGASSVDFDVQVAGRSFRRSLPVRTLADAGVSECPAAVD